MQCQSEQSARAPENCSTGMQPNGSDAVKRRSSGLCPVANRGLKGSWNDQDRACCLQRLTERLRRKEDRYRRTAAGSPPSCLLESVIAVVASAAGLYSTLQQVVVIFTAYGVSVYYKNLWVTAFLSHLTASVFTHPTRQVGSLPLANNEYLIHLHYESPLLLQSLGRRPTTRTYVTRAGLPIVKY